eukprot:scaffold35161_cov153-Amphora_coffeaeformis.AAC.4
MSIQLLSVGLATLIALFKDNELAMQVTQEDLMLLIRETATALLDPRLVPGASVLDEATSTQMVRAINKTTISAASGVPRHTSLQALLTIQQQLCLEPSDDPESGAFHRRMSRVITKLFARVVRHEEGLPAPFSPETIDMEALVCIMEDTLVACSQAGNDHGASDRDTIEICSDLVRTLVQSIVKTYGGPSRLLNFMNDLGIDESSELGKLVQSLTKGPVSQNLEKNLPPRPNAETSRGPSVGVLVSAFVNAKEPGERQNALSALRAYKQENGESELKTHLEQVSPAFRAFLEEQLSALNEPSPEKGTPDKTSSMSERLRNLRSRIAGSDLKVQTENGEVTSSAYSATSPLPSLPSYSIGHVSPAPAPVPGRAFTPQSQPGATISFQADVAPTGQSSDSPPRTTGIPTPSTAPRSSRLTHPSPTKLPTHGTFRERLAASGKTSGSTPDANSSRAAALRARLEAMRHQGK